MMIPWSTWIDRFPSKISPNLFVYTLYSCTSDADCPSMDPHIHLVATERSNQPGCFKYEMGASGSSSPFVTFSSRTCSFTLSFSIEDRHWFSSNCFTGGSIQYPLLLSFCRFELPWFDFQKTVLWAGTSVTSTCQWDATA